MDTPDGLMQLIGYLKNEVAEGKDRQVARKINEMPGAKPKHGGTLNMEGLLQF